MKSRIASLCAVGGMVSVALSTGTATGQIITPVSGTPEVGSSGTNIAGVLNGSGISGIIGAGATHSTSFANNSYVQSGTTMTVTFDLGGVYSVDGVLLWNQNAGGPGASGSSGVRGVNYSFSTDGVNFDNVTGAAYSRELGNSSAEQADSFTRRFARYVRLFATSNWGDSSTAISEIRFTGTQTDCNGNNIDDEWEVLSNPSLDLNSNGIPDDCDIASGTSTDFNGNGVPDEFIGEFFVYNIADGELFFSLQSAMTSANFNELDDLYMSGGEVNQNQTVPAGVKVEDVVGPIRTNPLQIGTGLFTLEDGCDFDSTTRIEVFGGGLIADYAATVNVSDPVDLLEGGSFLLRPGSYVFQFADLDILDGTLTLQDAIFDGDVDVGNFNAPDLSPPTGFIAGFGTFAESIDVYGDGEWLVQADTQAIARVTLQGGRITVQNGVLTAFAGIDVFSGAIVGDTFLARGSGADGGAAVYGTFFMSDASELRMPSAGANVRAADNFEIAINSNTRFDMAQASIQMIGDSRTTQTLELMSLDIGPDALGLDRTIANHYPIGTLRIGPAGTTVNLVDAYDNANDGMGGCEALYVSNLIIDAGSVLNTNGCPIYYETLTIEGVVDDPANLIQIVGACSIADLDADGDIDVFDLITFLQNFEPTAVCPGDAACSIADLDNDDDIDVFDLILFLQNFDPDDPDCQPVG